MNIAIVGLGVIGGSFAKAIHQHYKDEHYVMAIDLDENALQRAIQEGVIQEGATTNDFILERADLVIFALYPVQMKAFIKQYFNTFKQGAILTDTTGVKEVLFNNFELRDDIEFVFGHPMAGREKKGYDFADANVFIGANYVITPTENNNEETIQLFSKFVKRLGFKRITIASPSEHDARIAYTSQLTHAIAVALINSDDHEHETVRFIGDSFRDLTRIANMNEVLWSELFLDNKTHLLDAMERFELMFNQLKVALHNSDTSELQAQFIESTRRRTQLDEEDLKYRK